MKRIALFAFMLLTLFACKEDDDTIIYYTMSKNMRPRYDEGKEFAYYSEQTGKTVKYSVEKMNRKRGSIAKLNEEHYTGHSYTIALSSENGDSISIYQTSGGFSSRFNGENASSLEFYAENGTRGCFTEAGVKHIEIDGNYYYALELRKSWTDSDDIPTAIYYSYQCGILRLIYNDSVTYEILNPIVEKNYQQ